MIIYTYPHNFLAIKISLSAEIGGISLKFESVESNDLKSHSIKSVPKKFPFLEIINGYYLFSPNSICRCILPVTKQEEEINEWLDWESSQFLPYVLAIVQSSLGTSKIPSHVKDSFQQCLVYLEEGLCSKSTLFNAKTPGLLDAIVWSSLCVLANDSKLKKEYLGQFPSISSWYDAIEMLDTTNRALKRIFNGKDASCLKDIILEVSLPLPITDSGTQKKNSTITLSPSKVKPETSPLPADEDEGALITPEEILAAESSWFDNSNPDGVRKAVTTPVLPKKGERNILITSALPYVNNVPHLGNMIGCVLSADVFARYCRLRQYNTLYICGTDEYGTATETKALEEKITPEEICTKYNKLHKEIYDWFAIQFDYFGRTSTPHQTVVCQDVFWKLYNGGFLQSDTTEQLFCNNCSRFLADRFVEGVCPFCSYDDARGDQCDKCQKLVNPIELIKPRCKVCQHAPQLKSSEHLFLDLPKLEPMLREWLDMTTANGYWTTTAKVICQAWLKEGLRPRAITRDLKWGVPVPLEGFTNKVFYVWFDAPIGYLSMTAAYTPEWEKWWKNPENVQLYQFMAKDNVPFHGIVFPSCCLGSKDNFTIVNHLAAIEYLNYEDSKFSKSRGTGVFGDDAQDTGIPADIFRFYLLYIRPESQDTVFSWTDLMTKNNSELLNNLGNYALRALTFIHNNFGGKMPSITLNDEDKILLAKINKELHSYIEKMEKTRLRDGIRPMLTISRLGNQHIQGNKPWELVKGNEEQRARAGSVMGLSANVSCLLSLLMDPYMPSIAQQLRDQLNFPCEKKVITSYFRQFLSEGHPMNKPSPLFKKIELEEVERLKKKYAGKQESSSKDLKPVKTEPEMSPQKVNATELVTDPAEIKILTDKVVLQGEKIRQLKSQKAEKSVIDGEVAVLLSLKKSLLVMGGVDPSKPASKKGKK